MPIGCKAVNNGCAMHTHAVEQMGDVTGNPALVCLTNINVYVCVCVFVFVYVWVPKVWLYLQVQKVRVWP